MALSMADALELTRRELGQGESSELAALLTMWWHENPHSDERVRRLLVKREAAIFLMTSGANPPTGLAKRVKRGDTEYEYGGKGWDGVIAAIDKQLMAREGLTTTAPVSRLPNSYDPADSAFTDDIRVANVPYTIR